MLEELKLEVLKANQALPGLGLAVCTWGNVSAIDRKTGLIVIKPSGVEYLKLKASDLAVVDLEGKLVEGLKPSSDTPTHLELYKAFENIGSVVHTHSPWAVSWAQARRPVPCYGTTHADHFFGEVPCCGALTDDEINFSYEKNTGLAIIRTFKDLDYRSLPGVLCPGHGPFAWGKDPMEAVLNALALEEIAKAAFRTEALRPNAPTASSALMKKHYLRKHGPKASYGQASRT